MAQQSIDFLPASFHQQQLRVKRSIWRKTVLVFVLGLIALGTFRQRDKQRELQTKSRQMRKLAIGMIAKLEDPTELRDEIRQLQARVNLISHLRIHVPPTLLVSSVTNCLPEYVSLTRFESTFESETLNSSARSRRGNRAGEPVNPSQDGLAEERDSQRLSEVSKNSDVYVTVSGIAPNDRTISKYLAALSNNNVFNEVKLIFTDKHTLDGFPMRSFEIRLKVRKPGAFARSAS